MEDCSLGRWSGVRAGQGGWVEAPVPLREVKGYHDSDIAYIIWYLLRQTFRVSGYQATKLFEKEKETQMNVHMENFKVCFIFFLNTYKSNGSFMWEWQDTTLTLDTLSFIMWGVSPGRREGEAVGTAQGKFVGAGSFQLSLRQVYKPITTTIFQWLATLWVACFATQPLEHNGMTLGYDGVTFDMTSRGHHTLPRIVPSSGRVVPSYLRILMSCSRVAHSCSRIVTSFSKSRTVVLK